MTIIDMEAQRMKRQLKTLEKFFPRERVDELRRRTPEENKELVAFLLLYAQSTSDAQEYLHAHIRREHAKETV